MRLSRSAAVVVAVFTLLPLAYILYFTGVLIPHLMSAAATGGAQSQEFSHEFQTVFRTHLIALLLVALLMAFYLVYLFRTDRVRPDKKALWAVVLFLGNLLAMPVFWYLYVWPRRTGAA